VTVDPDAAAFSLGGRYSLDDLDGLLRSIERVLPVRILRRADGSVRILRNDNRGK
jgi:ferric-dicitrate binding protein FerR (iron transport regulator)